MTRKERQLKFDSAEASTHDGIVEPTMTSPSREAPRDRETSPTQLESTQLKSNPREQLIKDHKADPELAEMFKEALTEEEAQDHSVCYFQRSGIPMAGHLGINKTYQRILNHFC